MMGTCLGTTSKLEMHKEKEDINNGKKKIFGTDGFSTIESKRPTRSNGLKLKMSLSPYDNLLTNVLDSKPSSKDVEWISAKIKKRPDFSSLSDDALYNISSSFLKIETKDTNTAVYLGSTNSTVFIVHDGEISVGTQKYKRGDVFGASSLVMDDRKTNLEKKIQNNGKGKCCLWVMTKSLYQKQLISFARQNNSKMDNLIEKYFYLPEI